MEITIIRHGKPIVALKGKARSREIPELIERYNLSGIAEPPPKKAIEKASTCNVAVCSDFIRSMESAKALGFNTIHLSDPVFREVAIPHFTQGSFALPVSVWGVLLRSLSVFGFSKNGESLSMARERAQVAASMLIDIAKSHSSALFVGHGFINYFIAKELLSRHWVGPTKPGRGYWDYGVYECVTS